MGRVARYKKTKASCNHRGGEYVWGSTDALSISKCKKKKRSLIAQEHQLRKMKRRKKGDDDFIHGSDGTGGFNLPPEQDDFDLNDPNFAVKKQKKVPNALGSSETTTTTKSKKSNHANGNITNTNTDSGAKPSAVITSDTVKIGNQTIACNIPTNDREELKAARLLKIDPNTGKQVTKQTSKKSTIQARQPGESMRAFRKRLKEETKLALALDHKKGGQKSNKNTNNILDGGDDGGTMTKSQRRKEYLNKKKLKKKKRPIPTSDDLDEEYDSIYTSKSKLDQADSSGSTDRFITGEQAAARISFLEQAEQPPIFQSLPRGAQNKLKLKMRGVKDSEDGASSNDKNKKDAKMNETQIKAEHDAMEAMRRKVQAQYALVKARRRQKGSAFHL